MQFLIVTVEDNQKAEMLMEFLKSSNFVNSIFNFDKYLKGKRLLDEVNRIAKETGLSKMTEDEINEIVQEVRKEEQDKLKVTAIVK